MNAGVTRALTVGEVLATNRLWLVLYPIREATEEAWVGARGEPMIMVRHLSRQPVRRASLGSAGGD
jgi:hypothetical protein